MKRVLLFAYVRYERFRTLRAYRNGDWRKIPIKENGEPLVIVPQEYAHAYYCHNLLLTKNPVIYLRESVLERFLHAEESLKRIDSSLSLVIYDGWRSIDLQERLFWFYLKKFTARRFSLESTFEGCSTWKEIRDVFMSLSPTVQSALKEANRSYVSWPTSNPRCPSPHSTGGAIVYGSIRMENLLTSGCRLIGWKKMLEHSIT